MPQSPIKRNFLTVRQAATELGVAERTILYWIDIGELEAEPLESDSRARKTWIIPLTAIEKKKRDQAKD